MKRSLVAVISLIVMISPAFSQVEQGANELSVSANFQRIGLGDEGSIENVLVMTVVGSYGRFVTDKDEVGGSLMMMGAVAKGEDSDDDQGASLGLLSIFYSRHFIVANPKMVPFAGGDITKGFFPGWNEDDMGIEAPSVWGIGVFGGSKYFLSEKTFLGGQLQFRKQTISVDGESTSSLSQILLLSLGTIF